MPIETAFKTNLMIQDILLMEDDNLGVAGDYIIQDMKLFSMNQAKKMTPSLMKKATTCFEKAYPGRPKAIFFFHIPSFFEMIHNMIKPFLSEKMKSRVSITQNKN